MPEPSRRKRRTRPTAAEALPDDVQKATRKPHKRVVEGEPGAVVRKTRTGPRPTGRPPGFPLPWIRPEQEETQDADAATDAD